MKIYNTNTSFTFGKYLGKSILQVAREDMGYINWCVINLDHFVITDDTIIEIKRDVSDFKLSDLAEQVRLQKMNTLRTEIEDNCDDFDYEDDYGSSGEKYGWYNGWSDDAIDDAFEGDPMNTWNVD